MNSFNINSAYFVLFPVTLTISSFHITVLSPIQPWVETFNGLNHKNYLNVSNLINSINYTPCLSFKHFLKNLNHKNIIFLFLEIKFRREP